MPLIFHTTRLFGILVLSAVVLKHATSLASTSSPSRPPIVIAGAGPASLVFAQRHLRNDPNAVIHIYEQRAQPPRYSTQDEQENGSLVAGDFAFGFGLTTRGLRALDQVPGLKDAVLYISRQSMTGTFMTNRRDMCAEMIFKLQQDFGDSERLKFHFESKVTGLVMEKDGGKSSSNMHTGGKVLVENRRDGSVEEREYSLLVAADGTNSNIRKDLVAMNEIKGKRYYNSLSWKALQLPAQPNIIPGGFLSHQGKGNNELCFVTPRYKDRFVLMFYRFNRKDPKEQANIMDATTVDELKEAIVKMFPNITHFPPDAVAERFLSKPPGQEVYMSLNRHAVPSQKVALIGDAAVGTYVLFGHGCVSSMERANLLADCLANSTSVADDSDYDNCLSTALETFSKESVKEGTAISDLNVISHILRNHLFRDRALKVRSKIQTYLVEKPEVPYSEILQERDVKWTIRLSKVFWRFSRRKAQL